MSKKLLSCGGLYIDDETITETDGILSASSGGELPEVTAEDNGDVLTVVSGAWEKATPSGGGVMIVHETSDALDKTWQEIYDMGFAVIKVSAYPDNIFLTSAIGQNNGVYYVVALDLANLFSEQISFITNSASGYPTIFTDGD